MLKPGVVKAAESSQTLKDLMRAKQSEREDMPAMDLGPVHEILGEDMPFVDDTQVGRKNLLEALRNKFGDGYMNMPGVKSALAHYETESKFMRTYKLTMGERHGR